MPNRWRPSAPDTWGVEVRPNETTENEPALALGGNPGRMGLTMGEMFDVAELAEDCARDRVYEFLFYAPPLVISGGTGSMINPIAVK